MGRAKNMELIADKKSRNTTFNNRKEGLIKKIYELTTLCDVNACMIIYGPKQEMGFIEPETWPPDIDEVRGIITDIYKPTSNKDSGSNKTVGLRDFFYGRKRKIEGDLTKLRKKNMEAKYPTRPEIMNIMTAARLREFSANLRNKSDDVKLRIEFLKGNNKEETVGMMNWMDPGLTQPHGLNKPGLRGIESHVVQNYPTIDSHQELINPTMTLLMNGHNDGCVQFGVRPSSNNTQCQGFYEVMAHGPKPLARHYGPSLPVEGAGPYMQMFPVMVAPQWPELQLWTMPENDGGDGQDDIVARNNQYLMNHKRARYYNE